MPTVRKPTDEALALERVVNAARAVQAALTALQPRFAPNGDGQPSTLELVEGYVAVKSLGPVPVKGLVEAVEVYEVTGTGPARTRLQADRAAAACRAVRHGRARTCARAGSA